MGDMKGKPRENHNKPKPRTIVDLNYKRKRKILPWEDPGQPRQLMKKSPLHKMKDKYNTPEAALEDFQRLVQKDKREHLIVVDDKGNVLLLKDGRPDSVSIFKEDKEAFWGEGKYYNSMHNHPKGGYSPFSYADLRTGYSLGEAQKEVISYDGYRFKATMKQKNKLNEMERAEQGDAFMPYGEYEFHKKFIQNQKKKVKQIKAQYDKEGKTWTGTKDPYVLKEVNKTYLKDMTVWGEKYNIKIEAWNPKGEKIEVNTKTGRVKNWEV